jgi:hypothetical protein
MIAKKDTTTSAVAKNGVPTRPPLRVLVFSGFFKRFIDGKTLRKG